MPLCAVHYNMTSLRAIPFLQKMKTEKLTNQIASNKNESDSYLLKTEKCLKLRFKSLKSTFLESIFNSFKLLLWEMHVRISSHFWPNKGSVSRIVLADDSCKYEKKTKNMLYSLHKHECVLFYVSAIAISLDILLCKIIFLLYPKYQNLHNIPNWMN